MATILRPTRLQRVASTIGCTICAGGATTVAITTPDYLLPVWIIVALVTAVAAVRIWVVRVEIHPERLVVVNWIRTYDVPWSTVARCAADNDGLLIRRRADTTLRPTAFKHDYRAAEFSRRHSRAAAAQLEKIRKQRARTARS